MVPIGLPVILRYLFNHMTSVPVSSSGMPMVRFGGLVNRMLAHATGWYGTVGLGTEWYRYILYATDCFGRTPIQLLRLTTQAIGCMPYRTQLKRSNEFGTSGERIQFWIGSRPGHRAIGARGPLCP